MWTADVNYKRNHRYLNYFKAANKLFYNYLLLGIILLKESFLNFQTLKFTRIVNIISQPEICKYLKLDFVSKYLDSNIGCALKIHQPISKLKNDFNLIDSYLNSLLTQPRILFPFLWEPGNLLNRYSRSYKTQLW